jgi:hypothetical protein
MNLTALNTFAHFVKAHDLARDTKCLWALDLTFPALGHLLTGLWMNVDALWYSTECGVVKG